MSFKQDDMVYNMIIKYHFTLSMFKNVLETDWIIFIKAIK